MCCKTFEALSKHCCLSEHVIVCSYTDPVISMELLRTVLQPSFNEDIRAVFRKYMKVSDRSCLVILGLVVCDEIALIAFVFTLLCTVF